MNDFEIPATQPVVPSHYEKGWEYLTAALAADALDALGYREQCLEPAIQPLDSSSVLIGRAFPVRSVAAVNATPRYPYEGLMAALDNLVEGSVFVFATGRSDAAGVWGELITNACVTSGVAGALTDGLVRDVIGVRESGFPVFSRGATPYDSKGRIDVIEHGQPVQFGHIVIKAGDVIVADADGVCIIPTEVVDKVVEFAAEKQKGENHFRDAVLQGMSVSEAFRTFGVL